MRNTFKIIPLITILSLSACGGGGSSSGGGESLAQQRDARQCASFANGNVINSCDFAIVVRTFAGSSTPVTVPANGQAADPDAAFGGFFGACRAPFTPVAQSSTEFDCQ